MLKINNISKNYSFSILLISLLFLIKALYLSFYVTPFAAVPDEIGHFAYTQDIAYGKGIPLLSPPSSGKSVISADVMGHVEKTANSQPAYNWIAQHPPVYYAIAAIPLKIGSLIINDPDILYRLPRIVSALSGALLLLVLFRTCRVVGLDSSRSTAVAAAIGFIPMTSHLSSGTNHDISLFLFCALATHFFAKYILIREIKDAYQCAIWLAIAGGTKMMTPLVLIAPMVFILILELSGPNRVRHAIGILLIAISIPVMWAARNFIYFKSFFYTSGTDRKPGLDIALKQNFSDYINSQPVFESIVNLFYGMFGHMAAGMDHVFLEYDAFPRHLKFIGITADGLPHDVFLALLFIMACICMVYISRLAWCSFKEKSKSPNNNSLISQANFHLINCKYKIILLAAIIFLACYAAIFISITSFSSFMFILFLPIPISIFLGIVAIPLVFYVTDSTDRIALYGFAITLFFGSVFLYHIYGAYLEEGVLRAAQGRYFYPVTPLIILSAAIVLMRLRLPGFIINTGIALLACAELSVYINQVIPFYLIYYQ
ncbi:Dolichyl-phosphate-mannose-protein mannosyltransferase [Collimonas sp. OK242]|uniref:glycosyltransferase family 39 protein n=1 Tax=Collimonas sp. OK242 TaxID=1798195 RepID=UPI000895645E|nr:glycosyltransferase family 39 protein [Collimonas sp. OK242]SDX50032.1 Dolichyl-phosphate-mannose-protein mannosyltransferase [Collimonas sp. OK242]